MWLVYHGKVLMNAARKRRGLTDNSNYTVALTKPRAWIIYFAHVEMQNLSGGD